MNLFTDFNCLICVCEALRSSNMVSSIRPMDKKLPSDSWMRLKKYLRTNYLGMKKIIKIILLLLVPFPFVRCGEDFLSQQKLDGSTTDVLFNKPEDALAAVAAVYDVFHGGTGDNDFLSKGLYYHANYFSQDIRNQGADEFYALYEVPTGFNIVFGFWRDCYKGIARSNATIPKILEMTQKDVIEEELANRLIGEAKFLRAIYYYYLAVNFGGVPLILEEQLAGNEMKIPRNTEQETFESIETDLKEAAEVLPWTYDAENQGRATKGAALAYLGQTQMWLANYNPAKWGEAKLSLKQVIDQGVYQLERNYFQIHEPENRNGIESIFEIQHRAEANQSWNREDHLNWMQVLTMPTEAGGWGSHNSTKSLYDSFEDGDLRRRASIIGPGEEHPSADIKISERTGVKDENGNLINTYGTTSKPWGLTGYGVVKYWRLPDVCGGGCPHVAGENNITLMRYAEVLLNYAEALVMADNDVIGALRVANEIRDRADGFTNILPDVSASSKEGAFDVIMTERRHEFAAEMSWWWTLRRAGMEYILRFIRENHPDVPITRLQANHGLLPIPQKEIDINTNLRQNPGY